MNDELLGSATTRTIEPEVAARLAEVRAQKERRARLGKQIRKERRVLLPCLALAALAHFSLGTARVQGHSMEPTLHTGDTLYVWKSYHYFTNVKAGDLIIVKMRHGRIAGEEIVKRVVFVQNAAGNAKWPERVHTPSGMIDSRVLFGPYVDGEWPVSPNSVMVLGDNYDNSMDSRDFGPVRADEIDGKVLNR